MTGPQDAVRDRLGTLEGLDPSKDPDRARRAVTALSDAVLGVLTVHVPRDPTPIEVAGLPAHERVKQVCTVCAAGAGWIGSREVYPCETVRAIMGCIGVRGET